MAAATRQFKGFRVYCDESNTDSGKPHPVYGAILVSLDDIREAHREIRDWRQREEMHGELAWTKVDGGLRLKKYKSLVDLLFALASNGSCCSLKPSFSIPVRLNIVCIVKAMMKLASTSSITTGYFGTL